MIFPEDGMWRGTHDVQETLRLMREAIARGEIPENELNSVFTVMEAITAGDEEHPDKHDITGPYLSALWAMGADDLARCLIKVDLIVVDNNIAIGIKGRPEGEALVRDDEMQGVMLQALRGVLCAHGLMAVVRDGKLGLFAPEPDPWEESIRQFQQELDEMDDPMSKWYKNKPKQGDDSEH